jgi:hypothetical protein
MTNVWNEIMCDIVVCDIKSIVIRLEEGPWNACTSLSCSIENFQDHVKDCDGVVLSGPAKNLPDKFNVEYDSGYGGQRLFGTIWMVDGTWWTRGEYDGSEWWQHHECPEYNPELHVTDY